VGERDDSQRHSGTFIYNYGLWDAQSDQTIDHSGYNGSTVFNNFGTFRKSAGLTAARQRQLHRRHGEQPGRNHLPFERGSFNINGTATANMIENSANLTGVNVINGNFELGGRQLERHYPHHPHQQPRHDCRRRRDSMTWPTARGDELRHAGVGERGHSRWQRQAGTFIYNYGLWDAQSDQQLEPLGYNGGTVFNNFGTFRKEFTSGTTVFAGGVTFNNTGKMDAQDPAISPCKALIR
jgi:uncharacterized membrane protein YiaA